MSIHVLSIAQAARELGVSTRTIRRFIKAGKLKADLVNGTFGPEYRISEIPAELKKQPAEPEKDENTDAETSKHAEARTDLAVSTGAESSDHILLMLKDLQEKNMALAAQLGAATERIRNLENQVKQLNAPVTVTVAASGETTVKKSWWQRLFDTFRQKS
jgi:MerR family copper efflux transcriptional regulator